MNRIDLLHLMSELHATVTSPTRLGVLLISDEGSYTAGEVGDRLGMSPAALSGLVKRMTSSGLVRMVKSPLDRRVKLVAITEPGKKFLNNLLKP